MSINATAIHEVRGSGGDDRFGGFFDPSTSILGIDYSQQTTPRVFIDGVSVSGFAVGTLLNLYGYTVSSGDLGNGLNYVSGINVIMNTGPYRITGVGLAANTWTLDRNCTTGATTGIVGYMGGCIKTIDEFSRRYISGNVAHCKHPTVAASAVNFLNTQNVLPHTAIVGYRDVRGSGTCDVVVGFSGMRFTGAGHVLSRLNLWCDAAVTGVIFTAQNMAENCRIYNASVGVHALFDGSTLNHCAISGCGVGVVGVGRTFVTMSNIYNNATGVSALVVNNILTDNIIHDNTVGVSCSVATIALIGNDIINNREDGLRYLSVNTLTGADIVQDNNFIGNGWFGVNSPGVRPTRYSYDGNTSYNNGSGDFNGFNDPSPSGRYASPIYFNRYNRNLTADPFVKGTYTINMVNGGGADMRNRGIKNTWLDLPALSGHKGSGPVQAYTTVISVGMQGGYNN